MPLRPRRHAPCSAAPPSASSGGAEKKTLFPTRSGLIFLAAFASALVLGCAYALSDGGAMWRVYSFDTKSNIAPSTHSFHVVCYGDSLTAGISPPLEHNRPFAPHLQDELNSIRRSARAGSEEKTTLPVVVTWRGKPGFTAEQMVRSANDTRYGISPFVRFNPRIPDVAVLLAGTNDLGRRRSTRDILSDIVELHELCRKMGIQRTVAVGVPPSRWQASHAEALSAAAELNDKLEQYCNSTRTPTDGGQGRGAATTSTYVPFPFQYDKEDERWAKDGLHFTPKGYADLGHYLAKPVDEILSELRRGISKSSKVKRMGTPRKGSK
mmetsp:Transcript_16696/g.48046  ORF Transcript_16696/g.48046 Transcript_16696/m.48046 type:complete len:324 (-) Transcript_16696:55-1026(-)